MVLVDHGLQLVISLRKGRERRGKCRSIEVDLDRAARRHIVDFDRSHRRVGGMEFADVDFLLGVGLVFIFFPGCGGSSIFCEDQQAAADRGWNILADHNADIGVARRFLRMYPCTTQQYRYSRNASQPDARLHLRSSLTCF
jgi:hypothetical protein